MQGRQQSTERHLGTVLSLVLAVSAYAGVASRASLTSISEKADAIVVGSVDASRSAGVVTAAIVVARTLKGTLQPGNAISLTWVDPQWGAADEQIPPNVGLFFLVKTGRGGWALLPFVAGDAGWADAFIPIPLADSDSQGTNGFVAPQGPAVLEKVVAELVNAILRGKRPPVDLVDTYRSTGSPTLDYAFRKFAGNSDADISEVGVRGLLAMGDPAAVKRLHERASAESRLPYWPSTIQELKTSYQSSDANSISSLGAIVLDTKTPADLRSAAAWCLARLHVRGALPYLAQALEDSDVDIEAAGVGGLSSFANNVPVGSHEPAPGPWKLRTESTITHSAFDAAIVAGRQSYYVDYWKHWWAENQAQLR